MINFNKSGIIKYNMCLGRLKKESEEYWGYLNVYTNKTQNYGKCM